MVPKDTLPNVLPLLAQAIRDRRCVAIRYYGQRQIRVIEPHAIYRDERGEMVVDAYQIRGFSSSGRPTPFWRPFRLKKIVGVSVLKESFEPRVTEGFSPDRLKYRNGVVAIAQERAPAFAYPAQPTEMGPFLPEHVRRN